MTTVLLVVHAFIALALVVTVLLQRSEGGALGIGGGGGMSGFLTGRATANMLTRATAILAVLFFVTSIALAIIAGQGGKSRSIIDDQPSGTGTAPLPSDPAGLPTSLPATGPVGAPGAAPVAPAAGDQGPAAPSR
ncbi:MAG: preprotein translocase subunit SecG [Alphaproteobacteria bacterium]